MNVLFITPVEEGSGETITSVHMARNLDDNGHRVAFLATPFARRFIDAHFSQNVIDLTSDAGVNAERWREALQSFRPSHVVFADYPMLFFEGGVAPLARAPGWLEQLPEVDAELVTLDHFGFAQHEMTFFFGPPHLTHQFQRFPAIPERMHILLPCPMHEPRDADGRRGTPFRYWDVPIQTKSEHRDDVRARYTRDAGDVLILHAVPNWAWQAADVFQLPLYRYISAILDACLSRIRRPVTIVSVNNGHLLREVDGSANRRIINLPPIPTEEFERLLFAADLFITDNKVSIAMGKAVCGFEPCAALVNTYSLLEVVERTSDPIRQVVQAMERERLGTVFRHDVFPSGMQDLLREIVLYKQNSLTRAFWEVQLYGGDESAIAFARMIGDDAYRESLRDRQREYVDGVRTLPDAAQALLSLHE